MAGQHDLDIVRVNVGDSERTRLYKEMLKSNSTLAATAHDELRKSTDRLKNGGNSRLGTPAAFVGRSTSEVKKEESSLSRSASASSVSKKPYNLDHLKSSIRRDSRCAAHAPELEHLLRSTGERVEAICNRLEQADAEALGAQQQQPLRKTAAGPTHNIQIVRRGFEASGKEKRARADAAAANAISKNVVFDELDILHDALSQASYVQKSGKRFSDRVPPFRGMVPELLTLTKALEKAQQWEKDGCAGFCFEGDPVDKIGEEIKLEISFKAAPPSGAADTWPDTALDFDENWTTYERKGLAFKHLREFFPRNSEPHPYLPFLHDHALREQSNFQKAIWGEPCLPSVESALRAAEVQRGPNFALPKVKNDRNMTTPPAARRMKRDKSVWF